MKKSDDAPFMISGPDVLGVILWRNQQRAALERRARMTGKPAARKWLSTLNHQPSTSSSPS